MMGIVCIWFDTRDDDGWILWRNQPSEHWTVNEQPSFKCTGVFWKKDPLKKKKKNAEMRGLVCIWFDTSRRVMDATPWTAYEQPAVWCTGLFWANYCCNFYLVHTPPEMHDCIFDKWQEEEVQENVALDLFCFFWQGYNTRPYLFTRTLSFCEFNVIEEWIPL